MLNFRPFDKTNMADYEAMIANRNAAWPDELRTIDELIGNDKTRQQKFYFSRFVVEKDGVPIGYAACNEPAWSYRPNKYQIGFTLHPDHAHNRAEVFAFIHDQAVTERNANHIITMLREDKTDDVQLYTDNGFVAEMRYPTSRLDLAGFDFAPFAGLPAKIADQGIKLMTMAEFAELDANWKKIVYEFDNEITKDVPLPDEYTPPPLAQYWKQIENQKNFTPSTWFLAVDSGTVSAEFPAGEVVGISTFSLSVAQPERAYTGFTGVRRSYRRKGIATAVKLMAFRSAIALGATTIETDNEENNPMYDINMQLGFKPEPAWIDFKKVIDG